MTTYLVQNDNEPDQVFTITDSTGAAVNLTGTTCKFYFVNKETGAQVNTSHETMTLTTPASGIITYVWDNHTPVSPVDLATPGKYIGEIKITLVSGNTHSVFETYEYEIRPSVVQA